jgi:AraC-like DNA-binding protein
MAKTDRLSAIIARFDLRADVCSEHGDANLFLLSETRDGELSHIDFWPVSPGTNIAPLCEEKVLISAHINLGGEANPLAQALPKRISLSVQDEGSLKDLAQLIIGEAHEQRCGRATTLHRLFEVLIVIMLRRILREHSSEAGLFSGLVDDQISKAIVAVHENPEFNWRVEDLADRAGLSRSQFMQRFKRRVGQTPAQYLREWRLSLARQDLEKGDRVKTVAQRYCYGSQEALSRAFHQRYHCTPAQVRQQSLMSIGRE